MNLSSPQQRRDQQLQLPDPRQNHPALTKQGSLPAVSGQKSPKRAPLTAANLRQLEHMTGGSTRKRRRGNPRSEDSGSGSDAGRSKISKKTISLTQPDFYMRATKNGIIITPGAKQPGNLESLKERINRHRDSPSPTRSEYDVAAYKLTVAENESTTVDEWSKLLKDHRIKEYRRVTNMTFTHFPKEVGFNNGLSSAQPHLIEGLQRPEFLPFPIDDRLGGAAVPHMMPYGITLSHFAGELKGLGKDIIMAEIQASYIGATLVYARDAAREFLGDPDPVGDAHVVTFISDGDILRTFACYSSETDGQVLYHQFQITKTFVRDSYDEFKKARRQLRNLQDHAKEASESLRDELKGKWLSIQHDEAAESGAGEEAVDVESEATEEAEDIASGAGAPRDEAQVAESGLGRGAGQSHAVVDEDEGGGHGADMGPGTKGGKGAKGKGAKGKGAKGKGPGKGTETARRQSTRKKGPA